MSWRRNPPQRKPAKVADKNSGGKRESATKKCIYEFTGPDDPEAQYFPNKARPSRKPIEKGDVCGATTREGKSYCTYHVAQNLQAKGLLGEIAKREAEIQAAAAALKQGRSIVNIVAPEGHPSPIALEILQHLQVNGSKTLAKLFREMGTIFDDKGVLEGYISILNDSGWVQLGKTTRRSTVIRVTSTGISFITKLRKKVRRWNPPQRKGHKRKRQRRSRRQRRNPPPKDPNISGTIILVEEVEPGTKGRFTFAKTAPSGMLNQHFKVLERIGEFSGPVPYRQDIIFIEDGLVEVIEVRRVLTGNRLEAEVFVATDMG